MAVLMQRRLSANACKSMYIDTEKCVLREKHQTFLFYPSSGFCPHGVVLESLPFSYLLVPCSKSRLDISSLYPPNNNYPET